MDAHVHYMHTCVTYANASTRTHARSYRVARRHALSRFCCISASHECKGGCRSGPRPLTLPVHADGIPPGLDADQDRTCLGPSQGLLWANAGLASANAGLARRKDLLLDRFDRADDALRSKAPRRRCDERAIFDRGSVDRDLPIRTEPTAACVQARRFDADADAAAGSNAEYPRVNLGHETVLTGTGTEPTLSAPALSTS
jgi:hypothetical protein